MACRPPSGAPAAEGPAGQAATAPVNQTGAAMGGDALQCDRSIVIENPETAKAISDKAASDADRLANRLSELPGGAQASVTALAAAHTLDQSLLNRAFFAEVCERLAEKGISPAELKPALQNLAQALGLAYPDQTLAGSEAAAPAQTETDKAPKDSPAGAPSTATGLEIPRLATDEPKVQAEAKTPAETAVEPSAPLAAPSVEPAAPTSPTTPPVPATEAERAATDPTVPQAPAVEAVPSQSAQTPLASPPDAAAPASVPPAPGDAAPASAPEAAPEPAPERAMAPSAPEAPPAVCATTGADRGSPYAIRAGDCCPRAFAGTRRTFGPRCV